MEDDEARCDVFVRGNTLTVAKSITFVTFLTSTSVGAGGVSAYPVLMTHALLHLQFVALVNVYK